MKQVEQARAAIPGTKAEQLPYVVGPDGNQIPNAPVSLPAQRPVRRQALGGQRRIGGNTQPALGKQLSSRVQTGAIDQESAEKVAQDRAILKAAYGPNWRAKVYGDVGYAKRTRKALANNPGSSRLSQLNENLMAQRKAALEGAKQKTARKAARRSFGY